MRSSSSPLHRASALVRLGRSIVQLGRPLVLSMPLALLAAGCVTYQPEALEPDAELRRLEGVRLDDLAATGRPAEAPGEPGVAPFDYSNGLSADEAAGLATALNPELRAFRLERQVADGQLVGAGLLPNPELSTKWLVPVDAASWKGEVEGIFDLTQALLRRGLEKERARIRVEEVRWEVADREWLAATAARAAFVDLIHAEEDVRLLDEEGRVVQRVLEAARERQARGESSTRETLKAEAELADVERRARRLAGERRKALERLNGACGLPPGHETRIERPERPLAHEPVEGSRSADDADLPRRRPDLLAAAQAYEGAEKELQLACRKQVPRFSLGPAYERDQGRNLLGFKAALELPLFDRAQGEIAERQALRAQARRLYVARLAAARSDLHAAWTALEALDAELRHYFAEVAPRLERMVELTRTALESGEISVLELLEAQVRLLEARRDVTRTLRDFHRARVEVQRAAGPRWPAPPARPDEVPTASPGERT